jgi:hypothetical protein
MPEDVGWLADVHEEDAFANRGINVKAIMLIPNIDVILGFSRLRIPFPSPPIVGPIPA